MLGTRVHMMYFLGRVLKTYRFMKVVLETQVKLDRRKWMCQMDVSMELFHFVVMVVVVDFGF